jgi:hypothetical protein
MAPKNAKLTRGPATVAIVATVQLFIAPTVATIARIAARLAQNENPDDRHIEFEKRAAILEYDGRFSRTELRSRRGTKCDASPTGVSLMGEQKLPTNTVAEISA